MESGKVAQSLTSSNGNDAILKIADGDNDLGTITVQGGASQFLTIYDEDKLNESKATVHEFTNAYVKAAIKTFEEDEDIQSILTDGENSEVLAEIKAVNPELAAQIAQALKISYESSKEYLDTFVENNSTVNGSADLLPGDDDDLFFSSSASKSTVPEVGQRIDSFKNLVSAMDYEATALLNIEATIAKDISIIGIPVGKALSKISGSLSVGMAMTSYGAYSAMLYSENLIPAWQESGSLGGGGTFSQKVAKIRSYNSDVFDGWVKSHVDIFSAIAGTLTLGAMATAGVVGSPVIIVASVFAVTPIVVNWIYDNFVAKKLDTEMDKLQVAMHENFNEKVSNNNNEWMNRVLEAEIYVAPNCYKMSVYSDGSRKIYNGSWNYVRQRYNDEKGGEDYWDYLKKKETYYYYEDRNGDGKDEQYSDWRWKYIYDGTTGDHATVSGNGANLKGSAGNDYIDNAGTGAKMNGG